MGLFHSDTPVERSESELRALARETRGLALYHHQLCPLSIRTCRMLRQLNVPIECRNIRRSQVHRDDLIAGIGHLCTPCLKVAGNGEVQWICGEHEVIAYLEQRFAPAAGLEAH